MTERLVIIGNGMAATRLLSELDACEGKRFRITVVGEEDQPGYNRVLLSRLLSKEIQATELVTHDHHWYTSRGITLRTGTRATSIDRDNRQVRLENGEALHYDRLVLATGSRPFLPPVEGLSLAGVMTFRHMQDCTDIQSRIEHDAHIAVIGGGLLGLEAAHGINLLGGRVTVIHNADWLLNRQLDSPAAELLQASLEARGITVKLGVRLSRITSDKDGAVSGIALEDGAQIDCDAIVLATGIQPNHELASQSGLAVKRGICVDGWLRSCDPNIYAFGECAEVDGQCIGLVEPAWQQAAVLAQVLQGHLPEPWQPLPVPTQLKVSGEEVFSAGNITDARAESLTFHDPVAGQYRHLLVRNQLLVGAVLYGDTEDSGFYYDLMRRCVSIKPMRKQLLFGPAACEATP